MCYDGRAGSPLQAVAKECEEARALSARWSRYEGTWATGRMTEEPYLLLMGKEAHAMANNVIVGRCLSKSTSQQEQGEDKNKILVVRAARVACDAPSPLPLFPMYLHGLCWLFGVLLG